MKVIEVLDWDSDFFGFKVGSLSIENKTHESYIISALIQTDNRLTYLFSKEPLDDAILLKYNGELMDTKTLFVKKLTAIDLKFSDSNIQEYTYYDEKKKLYELAYLSGSHSRFKLDSNISEKKFKEMYKIWVDNSLLGRMATKVYVYKEGKSILGFMTLNVKETYAEIGLIAVDIVAQGKSIGSKLIKSAEVFLHQNNIQELRVPTQKENRQAVRFYLKNNFEILEETLIYHFWKQ